MHADPRQIADPFLERTPPALRRRFQLLGAAIEFRSDSAELLSLVDEAYRDLPVHELGAAELQIELRLVAGGAAFEAEPPVARMFGGAGLLGAAVDAHNLVLVDPAGRRAVVQVSRELLGHPYHARYELVEFAVFLLASRSQGLVPLHAGCVGLGGVGALLVGESGAGKSTLALHAMLQGLDFLTEDASFVEASTLRVTGVANFLHLRFDALHWVDDAALRERIRASPMIRRRSGVEKHELDLRTSWARLATEPLRLAHLVFAEPDLATGSELLQPLEPAETLDCLHASQAYAAGQPGWAELTQACGGLQGWVLKRGAHPRDGALALRNLFTR
ncbi:serine kinase [Roseateles saccharophilus]|uniref:serine kinase n=1 Tax=Roseateles saccharophilus TaxID=304 RepID=UPI0014045C7B|nr:serine kinase [Roseateles saccharophilus]